MASTVSLKAERVNERIRNERALVAHPITTDIDISSNAFWTSPPSEKFARFSELRRTAPVSFHRPIEIPIEHNEQGFWAVTKADLIQEVASNEVLFSSALGNLPDAYPFVATAFFHWQDGEEHRRNRRLVSSAFTPKRVARMIEDIRTAAKVIVDDLVGAGDVDFVQACSGRLPSLTGAQILGVPESHREEFSYHSNVIVGKSDPKYSDPADPLRKLREAADFLHELGHSMAAYRRKTPGDDLVSDLLAAEVDGHRLSDDDIGGFVWLMTVGANDTTKQSTSQSMLALHQHPDQLAWLMENIDERIDPAVEEFLRWATPVMDQSRTVTEDTDFHASKFAKGDKVVMFYAAGNRDEERFVNPEKFDLSRFPNPHMSFGGGGVHYCLGNRLAVTNLRTLFSELLTRTTVTITGEPEYLLSYTINGIKSLPAHIR